MLNKSSVLGILALLTLLTGILSGVVFAPKISNPLKEEEGVIQKLGVTLSQLGIHCKKIIYANETIESDSIKSLKVDVSSGEAVVKVGKPRIIVYTLKGILCNPNQRSPRWNLSLENGTLRLEVHEGIVELYIQPEQLESLQVNLESGIIKAMLGNLNDLETSETRVTSGMAAISLAGLESLNNYTADVESGAAYIDLDFNKNSDGTLHASVESGQLNIMMKGNVSACLKSSRVVSGLTKIDLPEECSQNALKVSVKAETGMISVKTEAGKTGD